MMMMRRFVERVLNSPQTRCQSQSNRWVLRCRANARGELIADRRAAGRLFQNADVVATFTCRVAVYAGYLTLSVGIRHMH